MLIQRNLYLINNSLSNKISTMTKIKILIIVLMSQFVASHQVKINDKIFLVPTYNLDDYQKFFLPKFQFKGQQHVYFNPFDINEVYKSKNIDPENLECHLKYEPEKHLLQQAIIRDQPQTQKKQQTQNVKPQQQQISQEIHNQKEQRKRPALREKGFTHFLHVPLVNFCKQTFENLIKPQIDPSDLDCLVDVKTLHVTIMVFRLKKLEDLTKWENIVRSIKFKKTKVNVKGVGIFAVKPNTNFTKVVYLKVEGLEDIIHDIVAKAIEAELVSEKQLSDIIFDKKTDMYKAEQHITLLKTKGGDIIDATPYIKMFNKINLGKTNVPEIRMSILGSFDGENYFDEFAVLP